MKIWILKIWKKYIFSEITTFLLKRNFIFLSDWIWASRTRELRKSMIRLQKIKCTVPEVLLTSPLTLAMPLTLILLINPLALTLNSDLILDIGPGLYTFLKSVLNSKEFVILNAQIDSTNSNYICDNLDPGYWYIGLDMLTFWER